MRSGYLVIFSAHIDSEEKLKVSSDILRQLKSDGVDVCISTHSTHYLDELSKLAKYVIYDDNNEMLEPNQFINNSDLITDEFNKFGSSNYYWNLPFGKVTEYFPWSKHSKACVLLFRNGIYTAYMNHYKWVIYMEYDVQTPIGGYKLLFEKKIELLNKENKKCFRYFNEPEHGSWQNPTNLTCDVESLYNKTNVLHENWNLDCRNWIKRWGTAFSEAVFQSIVEMTFSPDEIITQRIQEHSLNDWGNADWLSFNKFKTVSMNDDAKSFFLHVFPFKRKDSNQYELCLFAQNNGNSKTITDLKVIYRADIIYNRDDFKLDTNCWFYDFIQYDKTADGYIGLSYVADGKAYSEYFNVRNIQKLHDNLLRIEFN